MPPILNKDGNEIGHYTPAKRPSVFLDGWMRDHWEKQGVTTETVQALLPDREKRWACRARQQTKRRTSNRDGYNPIRNRVEAMPFIECKDGYLIHYTPRPNGSHPIPTWSDLMKCLGNDPELIRREAMEKMMALAEAFQDRVKREQFAG
jgi:ribosomal protein S16